MDATKAIRCLAWELATSVPGTPHQTRVGSALARAVRSQGQLPSPEAVEDALAAWEPR